MVVRHTNHYTNEAVKYSEIDNEKIIHVIRVLFDFISEISFVYFCKAVINCIGKRLWDSERWLYRVHGRFICSE